MTAGTDRQAVLVTGGSGYLASWIIAALLARGESVRTTIRNLARADEVRAAIALHAPVERLTFSAADLLKDDGWNAAMAGIGRVLHVASPMPVREYKGTDLQTPAREGVRRVLEAAGRAGVPHVVMTSSLVAALPRVPGKTPSDETLWTDLADAKLGEYARSKTLAEQDAWAIAAASGGRLALTTILPAMVQGPAIGREVSGSLEVLLRMLRGGIPMVPRVSFALVDTRDVVDAHIAALDNPAARGERYIVASDALWFRDIARILKEHLGAKATKVSTHRAPDFLIRTLALFNADMKMLAPDLGIQRTFNAAKVERLLGRKLRSAREAVIAGGDSLIAEGRV